jgi:integrase/recombinase XerC
VLRRIEEARAAQAGGALTSADRAIADAVTRFLKTRGEMDEHGKYDSNGVVRGTWRKYNCSLQHLVAFCRSRGCHSLPDISLELLEDFRASRRIHPVTSRVELQTLRTFFAYCIRHRWITINLAKEIEPPRNLKPNEVIPYTLVEESLILAACLEIGRSAAGDSSYERLRARAMILILRHTALRISDVCTMEKSAVSWDAESARWRVRVRTQKSGEAVHLPIPEDLKLALDALPLPRNAARDCVYYFWNGVTSRRAVVGIAERTLSAVFKKSKVKDAHAHRFRHTLATRLLEQGASFEQVADVLGNSPAVVRKHYGKWSKVRQLNIDRLMVAHFSSALGPSPVTNQSHEKMGALN